MSGFDPLDAMTRAGAIQRGHFILSSGLRSSTYVQCAKAMQSPRLASALCEALAERIPSSVRGRVEMVASPAMGGVVVGYETARALGVDAMFCERVDGRFEYRRGFSFRRGARCLIVEDVVTTGGSTRECIEATRIAGGDPIAACCLADRSDGTADAGVPLFSLMAISAPLWTAEDVPADVAALPAVKPGSRKAASLRLGVNIDHVATVRNARGGSTPDVVRAARLAESAGADGVTVHLREDRRHIRDADLDALLETLTIPLNLECAAVGSMIRIAASRRPHACCLVPERREELTTEGGLDVVSERSRLSDAVSALRDAGVRTSLFVTPDLDQIDASACLDVDAVELHTGRYCETLDDEELSRLRLAASRASSSGLEVHAGHGLSFETVGAASSIPEVVELNIGHFLIGESVFVGLASAIREMRRRMDLARSGL